MRRRSTASTEGPGKCLPGTGADRELAGACRDLVLSGLGPLVSIGEPRTFAAKASVFRQGEPSRRFLVVASGRLKSCFQTSAGARLIVGLYGPGDAVGFGCTLAGRPYRSSVVALARSGCVLVERQRLLGLFARRPNLIADLLPRLAHHLTGCSNCLAETVCVPVEIRLARLFLRLLDGNGSQPGWICPRLSRQELAELTATRIETCSRVMSNWRRRRIVVTADEGFLVRDPAALEKIASA